jgi:hypothetical protein
MVVNNTFIDKNKILTSSTRKYALFKICHD